FVSGFYLTECQLILGRYRLYNTIKGAGTYLVLPTLKTDIERNYESNYRDFKINEHNEAIATGNKERPTRDDRPNIDAESHQMTLDFIKRFEDEEVLRKYRVYAHHEENDSKDAHQKYQEEKLAWNFKNMLRENEPIPIDSNDDFREAIKISYKEFEKRKTIAAIETAYEDYLFRIENKMSFERDEEEIDQAKDWIRRTKEYLIEARVFAGCPADLDMF
ncbi:MAG: hypothetical protein WCL14_14475, partial [Bacteroidota bacterium]